MNIYEAIISYNVNVIVDYVSQIAQYKIPKLFGYEKKNIYNSLDPRRIEQVFNVAVKAKVPAPTPVSRI